MSLFELWFSQGICPVVGLLGHMEVRKRKQIQYVNTYVWNLKKTQNKTGSDEPRGRTGIKMQT